MGPGWSRFIYSTLFWVALAVPVARAQVVDPEGAQDSGLNDSPSSALVLGSVQPNGDLQGVGWIGSNDANDVDFYRFDVAGDPTEVFLDVDLADDANGLADIDVGLDAALWVFDNAGSLIAHNDDGDFFRLEIDNEGTDPGSDPFGDRDAFIGGLTLPPGLYFAAIAWYGRTANAERQLGLGFSALSYSGHAVSGATSDATFATTSCGDASDKCMGAYRLDVRTTLVPEPSSAACLSAAVVTLAWLGGRRREGGPRCEWYSAYSFTVFRRWRSTEGTA